MSGSTSRALKSLIVALLAYSGLCLYVWPLDDLRSLDYGLFQITRLFVLGSLVLGTHHLDGLAFVLLSGFLLIRNRWARSAAVMYSAMMLLLSMPSAFWRLVNPTSFHPGNFFLDQPPPHLLFAAREGWPYPTALAMTYVPLVVYAVTITVLLMPAVKAEFKAR
jgi:hypothetical protein